MERVVLVAVSENGVIGNKGDLPWNLPADIQRFKDITMDYPIIMGRKTYDSIVARFGKPLPGRKNIVISRNAVINDTNVVVCRSLSEALSAAEKENKAKVFIIGGAQIYKEALDSGVVDRIEMTRIHSPFEGDSFFASLDENYWTEKKSLRQEGELAYTFVTYLRNKSPHYSSLESQDPLVLSSIRSETKRQQRTINLIPSENYASEAVMEACASPLINKYAEGYPGRRYYQGNEFVDEVEILAIERAKKVFGAEHVNVQPYSGSPANFAVFLAFLKPGETFMGFDLASGGHLTHGSSVNFSGIMFRRVSYTSDPKTGRLDMASIREMALREKPKLIISGATAYPRQIDFAAFQKIAEEVGAIHLADISHIAGLVAAGVHPSPFPFTDIVMTTTHKTLRGPRGAILMCKEKFAKQIDKAVFPGCQGGPHENMIAAKAVAFNEALQPSFKEYGKQIIANSQRLAAVLSTAGLRLISGGTDNHLILLDLQNFGVGLGKQAAVALERAGIVLNANSIPFDPSPPLKPSGLRLGTPMVTTRGMKESEMDKIGTWIAAVLNDMDNVALQDRIKQDVEQLCSKFPIYSGFN